MKKEVCKDCRYFKNPTDPSHNICPGYCCYSPKKTQRYVEDVACKNFKPNE